MHLLNIIFLCSLFSCFNAGQLTIEEDPLSLLIPVNERAVFTCRAHCENQCSNIYWNINGNDTFTKQQRSWFEQMGYAFKHYKRVLDRKYIIGKLTVNATEAVNNTNMYCVFEEAGNNDVTNRSLPATLLVVANLPISSNPSIEKNSTHLSLFWSPPFLWPGQRIDYYNISFINKSDSSIAYYTVNSTFRDRVVKFTRMIHENDIMCKRTEIEFFISAFNVSGYPLPSFNISDWITPTPLIDIQSNNWSAAINITLLKNSSTLYLIVDFELPTLKCASPYEELNYTLMVYNERGELVTQFGPVEYQVQDSNNVRQMIKSPIMEESQFYSLAVQVEIYTQTVTSNEHVIKTYYMANTTTHTTTAAEVPTTSNTFISSYKIVFGICLSVIAILLLVLMILIVFVTHLCSHHFKRRAYIGERRSKDTKARACNNMVHNPIYAGLSSPVYDSIWPLADTFDENHSPSANHRPYYTTTTNTTGKTASIKGMSEYGPSTAQQKDSLLW